MQDFFTDLTQQCLQSVQDFIAVVEVCGFNDWLLRLLQDCPCRKIVLIQPEQRSRQKDDRRDAAALNELLRANRDRFLNDKPVCAR